MTTHHRNDCHHSCLRKVKRKQRILIGYYPEAGIRSNHKELWKMWGEKNNRHFRNARNERISWSRGLQEWKEKMTESRREGKGSHESYRTFKKRMVWKRRVETLTTRISAASLYLLYRESTPRKSEPRQLTTKLEQWHHQLTCQQGWGKSHKALPLREELQVSSAYWGGKNQSSPVMSPGIV